MEPVISHLNSYQINFERVSEILKEIATEKHITQAELAAGITTRDHLNKILNGKRHPSLELLYLLCNKLEIDIKILLLKCHFKNYERSDFLMQKMTNALRSFELDTYEQLYQEIESDPDFQYGLGKQFLLKAKGTILLKKYRNYTDALYYLKLSLNQITDTKLNVSTGLNFLYTGQELEAYTFKSECLFKLGQKDEAIQLLTSLLDKRVKNYDSADSCTILCTFCYLSRYLYSVENYQESIKYALKGIEYAESKYIYMYLGDLYSIAGKSYIKLNDFSLAKTHLQRAYDIYHTFEYLHFKADVLLHCQKSNIQLNTYQKI